jgi:hypothetical protein
VGSFELVDKAPPRAHRSRDAAAPPITADEWASHFDASGRLLDRAALWMRVYAAGFDPALRRCAPPCTATWYLPAYPAARHPAVLWRAEEHRCRL